MENDGLGTSPEAIGARLKRIFTTLGYGTGKATMVLGNVARSTLSRYMTGDIKLTENNFIILAKELKVNMNYLFTGDETNGIFTYDSKEDKEMNPDVDFSIYVNNMMECLEVMSEEKKKEKLAELFGRLNSYFISDRS